MLKKALVLAAGVGSRLSPLTDIIPKALLDFKGSRMLEHVLDSLTTQGLDDIIINVHHHSGQMKAFIEKLEYPGVNISISDESEELMDTGGALVKARDFLKGEESFLVHNVDILTDLDIQSFYQSHKTSGALASLAVKDRETSRNLLIDSEGLLCGWRNNQTGEEILIHDKEGLTGKAFSGIHILETDIFEVLDQRGPFSMIKAYLELAKDQQIIGFDHSDDTWIDMAHRDHYPELGN